MKLIIILLLIIIAIPVIWVIKTSNKFRRMSIKIQESVSGIDVALTKRYDTLTKMVNVCREYAGHEVSTFEKVIELRKGMTMEERSKANDEMNKISAGINVLAENYPQLKSAEVFVSLNDGIRDAEAHLQAARRLYNGNVSIFNQAIAVFPSSIIAKKQKLEGGNFFEAEEFKREDVEMKF